MKRTLVHLISETFRDSGKMAFVSGPRQVGKTTLSRHLASEFPQSLYFNWDNIRDQKKLLKDPYFFEQENRDPKKPFLLIFDEIHKYARWKNYLKGAFDGFREEFRFLVTGSGRLDIFKKGGDSLLGRYFQFPLYPLTVGEALENLPTLSDFKKSLGDRPPKPENASTLYDALFRCSGFPEPFLRGAEKFYNQWFQERKTRLIREDIRDASALREISLLEILSHLIPDRVGNPLSVNALKEDVGVAFETVRDWLLLLEQFFYLFKIHPFTGGNLKRALRKESKVYLFDWVEVPEEGFRFENMVALHLMKTVHLWRTLGEGQIDLFYLRDKEKREVDFVLTERGKPFCLIECKLSDETYSPALLYYQQKLQVPVAIQLLHKKGVLKKTSHNHLVQWMISADHGLSLFA